MIFLGKEVLLKGQVTVTKKAIKTYTKALINIIYYAIILLP
jgi:hypothetical protein